MCERVLKFLKSGVSNKETGGQLNYYTLAIRNEESLELFEQRTTDKFSSVFWPYVFCSFVALAVQVSNIVK
jgi:hypothetical protein